MRYCVYDNSFPLYFPPLCPQDDLADDTRPRAQPRKSDLITAWPSYLEWDQRVEESGRVRSLKRTCVLLLNSIVEACKDASVLRNIAHRLDGYVLRKRLFYFYGVFLQKTSGIDLAGELRKIYSREFSLNGKTQFPLGLESMLMGDNALDLLRRVENTLDCSWELYVQSDEAMDEHFGEPLGILTLLKTIDSVLGMRSSQSTMELTRIVEPNRNIKPFINRKDLYPDASAYHCSKISYVIDRIYRYGFQFFEGNVSGIELLLRDKEIHRVYFVKPLSCNYVLDSTKTQLMGNIPTINPQSKLKYFVEVVSSVHRECYFTQKLSQLSLLGSGGNLFHFFFKNDSKNLDRLTGFMLFQVSFSGWES